MNQNNLFSTLAYTALGMIAFLWFWGFFSYAIGFLLNLYVSKTIDSGPIRPIGTALAMDTFLILLFGIQHSITARKSYKNRLVKIIPDYFERSFYVLLSNLVLTAIFVFWQPVTVPIWSTNNLILKSLLYGAFAVGSGILVYSLIIIHHFEFIGLRQIYLHLTGKPYMPIEFKMPTIYKYIRHPVYLGTLIVFWATPEMTLGHLFLALGMTLYTLIGVRFEERDLCSLYGEDYSRYMQVVGMLFPKFK